MKEKKAPTEGVADKSLYVALGGFAIVMIIPFFLFPNIATKVIFLTVVVIFSRATPMFDYMKVEIHSAMTIVACSVLGPLPGIYAGIASTFFVHPFGKYMGVSPWPHFVIMDSIYLIAIAYFGAKVPVEQLATLGYLVILIGQITLRSVRLAFFRDPVTRAIGLVTINLLFSYFLMTYLLPSFLKLFT